MLRSIKYGVNGAVLAGLVAAPVLWTSVDKTVQLVVDGVHKKEAQQHRLGRVEPGVRGRPVVQAHARRRHRCREVHPVQPRRAPRLPKPGERQVVVGAAARPSQDASAASR